ncbi:MAG: glycosyltransferase family 4 protein [Clostridia bacterium]|nr:glycosyltransferase family 4 protein [Clostridia bacterium]
MKIAFFSNFLNHHQLPLCEAFCCMDGVEFSFVACERIPEDRLKMGYEDMNTRYPFVVRAYEDEAAAFAIAENYDAVIFGACPTAYIAHRMKHNRLSFRFCERSLKKGTWRRFIPRTRRKIYEGYTKYKKQPLYILGASSYAASDLALCGFDKKKCFEWGYFPSVTAKDLDAVFAQKRESAVAEVLYAGRLLPLKHVMDTVRAVHNLKKQNIAVHFTIIGEGECAKEIKAYIAQNDLEDTVAMLPFMSPEAVREYMDKADVFVFGSNFYEGWGAVVNEAMNSACTLLVSHAVGSAAYLIRDGENGYVYPFADVGVLTDKLGRAVADRALRERLGREAYKTVTELWSAEVAAGRFIALCKAFENGDDFRLLFESGPCSAAVKRNPLK